MKMGEHGETHDHMDSGMRSLMDDLGLSMDMLLESSIFVLDPETFSPAVVEYPACPCVVEFRGLQNFSSFSGVVFVVHFRGLWALSLVFRALSLAFRALSLAFLATLLLTQFRTLN